MAAIQLEVMLSLRSWSVFSALEKRLEGTPSQKEGDLNLNICGLDRVHDVCPSVPLFLERGGW